VAFGLAGLRDWSGSCPAPVAAVCGYGPAVDGVRVGLYWLGCTAAVEEVFDLVLDVGDLVEDIVEVEVMGVRVRGPILAPHT
jgi:hypothetical protein